MSDLSITSEKPSIQAVVQKLRTWTDEDRQAVFKYFCLHCGSRNPFCQCWNDE